MRGNAASRVPGEDYFDRKSIRTIVTTRSTIVPRMTFQSTAGPFDPEFFCSSVMTYLFELGAWPLDVSDES
jgi:hypothetical protein